jgi:hypothetical protein
VQVAVTGSSDVLLRQCTFRQLGGAGVSLGGGSRDCTVEGCLLEDISGTGAHAKDAFLNQPFHDC